MNRDALKTLAGLGIIALIVVATYLYGNSQREAQLRSQKTAQTSPGTTGSASPKATTSASPSASPKATPTPSATPVLGAANGPKDGAMPQTGPELVPVAAAGVLAVMSLVYWRSRRAVTVVQRSAR